MKERPVIFNAEMVRAILDGRKTQTRRVMKVQPSPEFTPMNMAMETDYNAHWYTPGVVDKDGYLQPAKHQVFGVASEDEGYSCPFGQPGDKLWVREAFRVHSRATDVATLVYRASVRNSWTEQTHRVPVAVCNKPATPEKWTPSIHMPRWASRITLEITGVRVERLKDIRASDALDEGIQHMTMNCPRHEFFQLWNSIYGDMAHETNPWLWVITFRRVA